VVGYNLRVNHPLPPSKPCRAEFIEPMECLAVTKLPDGPDWNYEIKFDGYRSIGVKNSREGILHSRTART
jgi:ATP-dependent DNA ligase